VSSIVQRPLGRTGVQVSALGLGGHHLGDAPTYADAERIVGEAIDGGITFFDNCWSTTMGEAKSGWAAPSPPPRGEEIASF
jgi:predicted aldo/keto reductase-like oxidoreductase